MMGNYYKKYKDKIQNQHFVLNILKQVKEEIKIINVLQNYQLQVQIQAKLVLMMFKQVNKYGVIEMYIVVLLED